MKPSLFSRLKPVQKRQRLLLLIPLILLLIAVLVWAGMPLLQNNPTQATRVAFEAATATGAAGQDSQQNPQAPADQPDLPTPSATNAAAVPPPAFNTGSAQENLNAQGLMILAMRDGLYAHLFIYHPIYLPLTRLTTTPWDEQTPAISPDGTSLVYSARENGYWDLYLIDLVTGAKSRLTDTPEYEASPTWSPDGMWLAYERFDGVNQDIFILPLDENQQGQAEAIRLTDAPGVDRSPAWSPLGRQIAFVSDRSGNEDIWVADLDKTDNRYENLSSDSLARDRFPAWSADGKHLAWASQKSGGHRLTVWDSSTNETKYLTAEGDRPLWSQDGSLLFTTLNGPNQYDLTAYQYNTGRVSLPMTPLPGSIYGMAWVRGPLPPWLAQFTQQGDQSPSPLLYNPVLTKFPISPLGRLSIIPLEDVTAPQPRLHDAVDEAFKDLRQQIGIETGWDALSSLENAFIPVTTPNDPSLQDEWLYTGRAFSLNPLLFSAQWMHVTREEYGGQTYWRVYLKARYQDGSMGKPIEEMVWDINARYGGNTHDYEQGGRFESAPPGYWIDLTELAHRYGWERLPSMNEWRTYYPAIRANQFVVTSGMDWYAAMGEIYPPEALATSTPPPTETAAPTEIPLTPLPTLTQTPTITPIPTRRPTWTPLPGNLP